MKKKNRQQDEKTNVMRLLEQKEVPYRAQSYPHEEGVPVDGQSVARLLGQEPESVFKTLVTRGSSGQYYVFDIPVTDELDLKKAARAVDEKSIAMLPMAQLLPLTGYVRGGCSPIGMRKPFYTTFHETAILFDEIAVSAGKIGLQVILEPNALCELVGGQFADVTKE